MSWYWVAIIVGLLQPLLIVPRSLIAVFHKYGFDVGLAVWFSMLCITVPLMLLIMWIEHLIVG